MASFSFNFQMSEETTISSNAETTEAILNPFKLASPQVELPPARILVLDDPENEVDMKFPSEELLVYKRTSTDGATKKSNPLVFQRIDEERVGLSPPLAKALLTAKGPSDLITGVYEGGLRVWEGSIDLVAYLDTHRARLLQTEASGRKSRGKKGGKNKKKGGGGGGGGGERETQVLQCLDLGCGQGFPGIYALKAKKRWEVTFADFNEEVLTSVTWPNVLMNASGGRRFHASYVAGDWNSLRPAVVKERRARCGLGTTTFTHREDGDGGKGSSVEKGSLDESGVVGVPHDQSGACVDKASEVGGKDDGEQEAGLFDLILTAETCYTPQCCLEVARLLGDLLHPDSGVALVASKRFYFGTGGSAATFREACERLNAEQRELGRTAVSEEVTGSSVDTGPWELQVVVGEVIDDGRSNIREVMEVRRVTKTTIKNDIPASSVDKGEDKK